MTALQGIGSLPQLAPRPEIRLRYTFPYKKDMPFVLRNGSWPNPYLSSILYEKTQEYNPQDEASEETALVPPGQTIYMVPYHAVELHDARLASIDITKWTAVPASNSLLLSLFEIYFIFEYPFHSVFHKDLFLDDMLSGKQRFCSPLLVNAVLAAAWHGHQGFQKRSEYWRPDNLGYRFLAEARRLLEREQTTSKITTIQATSIMNLTLCTNGLDELSWSLLGNAINMARQLNLFTPSPESDPKWQKAAAITSWSVFNMQAWHSFHMFRSPPLLEPPLHHLPDAEHDPSFFGEVHVRYPGAKQKVDINHGHVFKAMSGFRTILNAASLEVSMSEGDRLLPVRLLHYWRSIEGWYSSLPQCLKARNIALPSHLKLHMHMHVLLIRLFEPFEHVSQIFAIEELPRPGNIVIQSKMALETLVRLHYSRHGFEAYDPAMPYFVSLLAWNSLRDYKQMILAQNTSHVDAALSTIMLCAKLLWEQGANHFLSEVVFFFFRSSLPSLHEVRLLREVVDVIDEETGPRLALMVQEVRSQWPVGIFSTANMSADAARLSHFIDWCERTVDSQAQQRLSTSQSPDPFGSPDAAWIQYP
ncbi:hypothetical protein PFICI_09069 [Pestalotiopsis fici W106-1]|uniref:Xylanolytic transcriptional activator regulatory domain-containing protein n=1 Tax=Pestalotiopsis fici (strain W106-1 / CGMCC3.15140) TaxID=1229662 RepID=W3X232_PESFW|nr:uncharacterized protein PFICI_09069 [Pestalotiopsis fici W106-1]ETS79216.1 hypothetical protein PFICI_09069 [Pestalotiopsis fici W106-1]